MPNPFWSLRAPMQGKGFFYGDNGPERNDLTTQAISEMLYQQRNNHQMDQEEHALKMRGGAPGYSGPSGSTRIGALGNVFGGGGGNARGGGQQQNPGGQMDVIYDRGPEMFAEQMKLKKRELDIEDKKADALGGLKLGELNVKRQNADANTLRADQMDDLQRARAIAAMEQIAARGGNQVNVQELRNTGATNVQGLRNTGATNVQELRNQGTMDAEAARAVTAKNLEEMRQGGATARNDANIVSRADPRMEKVKELYATRPEFRDYIQIDPNGRGYSIAKPKRFMGSAMGSLFGGVGNSGDDDPVWRELNTALNAPVRKSITDQPGKDDKPLTNPILDADHQRNNPTKPPKGAKPGGKWITLRNGKKIYQEP